mmetsp:Transcript_24208/g.75721  ORF Transcript_24208/g.75721 Transcript_24208/m.75721 type:complete len:340 (-) Transcript_24208:42-1061(-)
MGTRAVEMVGVVAVGGDGGLRRGGEGCEGVRRERASMAAKGEVEEVDTVCAAPAERGRGVSERVEVSMWAVVRAMMREMRERRRRSAIVALAPLPPAARARVRAAAKWGRTRELSQACPTPPNFPNPEEPAELAVTGPKSCGRDRGIPRSLPHDLGPVTANSAGSSGLGKFGGVGQAWLNSRVLPHFAAARTLARAAGGSGANATIAERRLLSRISLIIARTTAHMLTSTLSDTPLPRSAGAAHTVSTSSTSPFAAIDALSLLTPSHPSPPLLSPPSPPTATTPTISTALVPMGWGTSDSLTLPPPSPPFTPPRRTRLPLPPQKSTSSPLPPPPSPPPP